MLRLNELGYGRGGPLRLDLVFNPTGPSLPPDQAELQDDYKRELKSRYDIEFDRLLTITNIPIRRYAQFLHKKGKLESYLTLLEDNFNLVAADNVMCRTMLSIGWDGAIFDCDFNQMIEMPAGGGESKSVFSIQSFDQFVNERIAVADHCYGCTAGAGSSCSGAVVAE